MMLNLTISANEALSRIASFMDEVKLFWRFRYTGEKSFLGRIEGNRFFVFKKSDSRRGLPTLSGIVTQTDSGCAVQVRFKSNSFERVFIIVWFAMVVFFLLIGLLLFLKGHLSNSLEPEIFMAIIVPLAMLIFGIIFSYSGMKFRKREEKQLTETFLELFDGWLG